MKHIHAEQGPRLRLEVTERERAAAKNIKKTFKQIADDLEESLAIIYELRDAIVQERPSKEDLKNKFRGRLLRYKSKIVKAFNTFLEKLKIALQSLSELMDPEMIKLRGLLVAEFDELSDGIEAVIDLLKNPDKEGFTQSLERLCTQLQKRERSIKDLIDSQLIGHLEHDILGKMKISHLKTKIRKRTRLLRKLATER